jgi:hypothetical protein
MGGPATPKCRKPKIFNAEGMACKSSKPHRSLDEIANQAYFYGRFMGDPDQASIISSVSPPVEGGAGGG